MPFSNESIQPIIWRSVDLPEPDFPIMALRDPFSISNDTLFNALNAPFFYNYRFYQDY